jgi:hypothetical protein
MRARRSDAMGGDMTTARIERGCKVQGAAAQVGDGRPWEPRRGICEHDCGYDVCNALSSGTLRLPEPFGLGGDWDVSRVGEWAVAVGSALVLFGSTIVAAGGLPGLLAVGAGVACCLIGGLILAWVAHHRR